jgi:hypothetical protein
MLEGVNKILLATSVSIHSWLFLGKQVQDKASNQSGLMDHQDPEKPLTHSRPRGHPIGHGKEVHLA